MEETKTSYEWYQNDNTCDIVDPDGWRIGSIDHQYELWFNTQTSWSDYLRKRNRSTTTKFGKRKHKSPFGSLERYLKNKVIEINDYSSSGETALADDYTIPNVPESCRSGLCMLEFDEGEDSSETEDLFDYVMNSTCILL